MARVTLIIDMPDAIVSDIHAFWTEQVSAKATLAADLAATDMVLTLGQSLVLSQGDILCASGDIMAVVAVNGTSVTVARNVDPNGMAESHKAGDSIGLLRDRSVWDGPKGALLQFAQQVVTSRGLRSATFAATVSGTVELE